MSSRGSVTREASVAPQGASLPLQVVEQGSGTPSGLVRPQPPTKASTLLLEIDVLCSTPGAL